VSIEQYEQSVTTILDGTGNGVGILPGPRPGYILRITGGNVQTQGVGNPTATVYRNFATSNNVLASTRNAQSNNITGDGSTFLWYGENPLISFNGGSPGQQVTFRLIGRLERV
jgi:hypothetical protein